MTNFYHKNFLIDLGKKIKVIRITKGWKQDEMSQLCGISQSHLSKYERGTIEPPIKFLITLSELTGKELQISIGECGKCLKCKNTKKKE